MPPQMPRTFAEARDRLMLRVRDRFYPEKMRMISRHRHSVVPDFLHYNLSDFHQQLFPVADFEDASLTVLRDTVDGWGVSPEDVYQAAAANVWHRCASTLRYAEENGVLVASTPHGYASSMLCYPNELLPIDIAEPLVCVTTPDHFAVTDVANCSLLVEHALGALDQLDEVRCPLPIVFQDDTWMDWHPPEGHPVEPLYKRLLSMYMDRIYAVQKGLHEQWLQSRGSEIFVASHVAYLDKKSGRVHTSCTWTRGVRTLLPRTDAITMVDLGRPKAQQSLGMFTWDSVQEAAGNLLQPRDFYPERWFVDGFPEPSAFRRFRPL